MTIMHRMFRGLTGAVTGIALMVAFVRRPSASELSGPADPHDRAVRAGWRYRLLRPHRPAEDAGIAGPAGSGRKLSGPAGNVGMEMAASAAPDGYVIFMGDVGTLAINAAIFKDMKVVPTRDLTPVSIIADTPSLLVTAPNFPPNTVGGS